ncbi:MAG: hypothetical protein ACJ76F_06550, partial [Bacteroidia bacterium]
NGMRSFFENLRLFRKHYTHLFMMALATLITLSPQLFYWKYATGHWLYFSYVGEQFFYTRPHLLEYPFALRKGWFIYSPLLLIAVAGLFLGNRKKNQFFLASLLLIVLFVYLNSSWWTWWFGGGFGARSMIEIYPLLAIGFCGFFGNIRVKPQLRYAASFLLIFLLLHNIKSAYLYRVNKIHFDSMTWPAYKYVFWRIRIPDSEYEYLKTLYVHPDYDKAKNGIDT